MTAATGPVGAAPLSRSAWRDARWLVLAPHADDETLGAGALIADAAGRGRLAGVVLLTDGAGSHPHPDAASRARLRALRRHEAWAAVRRLGGRRRPVFLDWPDAHPPRPGDARFEDSARRLGAFCRRHRVDALAVTAGHEPHCDHVAAYELATAAARRALRPVRVFEYIVWGAPIRDAALRLTTPALAAGIRAAALARHKSQLTPLFGAGFRLDHSPRLYPGGDTLYLRRRPHG